MTNGAEAARGRCLAVAAAGTAAGWGAVAVLVRTVALAPPARTPDQALVRLCLAALALAAAWGWLQLLAGVRDAWRGARPGRAGVVRRLALAACGVALAGGLGAPAAVADTGAPDDVLRGLPLPERAEDTPAPPARAVVVVRVGDSLWRLAERDLPADASDAEITDRWHHVYAANRAVIGPDPDLLRPGQVLRLSTEEDR